MFVADDDTEEAGALTWDGALAECRSGPGVNPDLVSIDSEHENNMIMSQIQGVTYGVWIGLYSELGQHLWIDNSVLEYQNWREGGPESVGNKYTPITVS